MKLLLDTHIFLWYVNGDPQLSPAWEIIVSDSANSVYLSAVSVWEASIKYHLGKLPLPAPPKTFFPVQRQHHGIAGLPLDEADLSPLESLPTLHRDPFDRVLICQALVHGLTLVTVDTAIRAYPIPLLAEV